MKISDSFFVAPKIKLLIWRMFEFDYFALKINNLELKFVLFNRPLINSDRGFTCGNKEPSVRYGKCLDVTILNWKLSNKFFSKIFV